MTARTLRLRKAIRGGRQEAAQATSPVGGRARSRTGCLRVMSPAWSRFTRLLRSRYCGPHHLPGVPVRELDSLA